jgi:hypothetical protein
MVDTLIQLELNAGLGRGERQELPTANNRLVGLAHGATAIGALAICALAVGRLVIRQGRIDKLTIGELTIPAAVPQIPRRWAADGNITV